MTEKLFRYEGYIPATFTGTVSDEIKHTRQLGEQILEDYQRVEKYLVKAEKGGIMKNAYLKKIKNSLNQTRYAVRNYEMELRHMTLYIDLPEDSMNLLDDNTIDNALMKNEYRNARIQLRHMIEKVRNNIYQLNAYCN